VEDVVRLDSLYKDEKLVPFFRIKIYILSTRREENDILEPCRVDDKVCFWRPQGLKDEIFHMYSVIF